MPITLLRRRHRPRLLASVGAAAFLFLALVGAAGAGSSVASGGALCLLTPAELSAIVGRTVQRVNLGDPGGDPNAQCSFAHVGKVSGRVFPSPQVFLTVSPGGASDLRELYAYYLKARTKLATRPQIESRPDLGPGAFTLSSTTSPVVTAFFLTGKNGVATLLVDLADAAAGKRDLATADKVVSLVRGRLR